MNAKCLLEFLIFGAGWSPYPLITGSRRKGSNSHDRLTKSKEVGVRSIKRAKGE